MRLLTIAARICAGLLIAGVAAAAFAADFAQPERTPEYVKACRRQDSELKEFFIERFPGTFLFNHLRSFKVTVHREGLERAASLVPVRVVKFASADALRNAARVKPVVVGALKLTYGNHDPLVDPGNLLLLYDEQHVHLRNSEGLEVNHFDATLQEPPATAAVDPLVGSLTASDTSLANILPDGTLQLYVQLADSKGKALQDAGSFTKLLISFNIPGIVTDDDSPERELAKPPEDEKDKDKTGSGDSGSAGAGGGVCPR